MATLAQIKMFGPTSAEQKRWSCLADAESIIARNNDQRNQGRGMIAVRLTYSHF